MSKIYISGPITGISDYMLRFESAEIMLKDKGHSVVNPAKIMSYMPKDTTWSEYMDIAMVLLSQCDGIYMLRGWKNSRGAKRELLAASHRNMRIDFEESDNVILKIKEIMREKEVTQTEIAKLLNVSKSRVSKWLSGDGMPTSSQLREISELLNVNICEIG